MATQNLTGKGEYATAFHQLGSVDFMRSGAYCNLNDIAKPFGKRIDNWLRLDGTKRLFEDFKKDFAYGGAEPIITVKGNFSDTSDLRYQSQIFTRQGTYAHPDIAIQFAQWCSPGFALWVSRQIRHLMTYGEVNLHYREWTEDQVLQGNQLNRDDLTDLYGSRK